MLDDKKELNQICLTLIQLFHSENETEIAELLKASETTAEVSNFDNWNGGTYYYNVNINVPVTKFTKIRSKVNDIEALIKENIEFLIRSKESFHISQVFITPTYTSQSEVSSVLPDQSKIQLSTRQNILDGFLVTGISWNGNLDQIGFLERLYDLSKLPSKDPRYMNSLEDIFKHTVANNDWPEDWIFTDNRFNLLYSSDNTFLSFICMTLHPAVRSNDEELTTLQEIFTNNLKRDGFTIEKEGEIAGRPMYVSKDLLFFNTEIHSSNLTKPEIRKALIIGCSEYEHAPTLKNPFNDATEMEATLKRLGFEVTTIIDPSQKEMKMGIDEFGENLKGVDVGLFYFAGHGVQVKGLNYLIPVDAKLTSEKLVEYDCIEAGRVLAYMENASAMVNLVILDACRNNPFERSWRRGVSQRGLASMNAPKGSLIAYSTAPGTTASDGSGNNGLYTEILLNHISSKSTPVNTMFQAVRLQVMLLSKEEQIPWESTSLTADFYFNK